MPWSKRDSRSWSARSSRRWRADPPWNHGPAVAALDEPRPLAADRFGTVTFRPRCAKDKVTLLAGAHVRGGKGADGRGAPRGRLRVGRNGQGATERRGEDASRSAASGGRGGNPQHLLPKDIAGNFMAASRSVPVAGYIAYSPPGSEGLFRALVPPEICLLPSRRIGLGSSLLDAT